MKIKFTYLHNQFSMLAWHLMLHNSQCASVTRKNLTQKEDFIWLVDFLFVFCLYFSLWWPTALNTKDLNALNHLYVCYLPIYIHAYIDIRKYLYIHWSTLCLSALSNFRNLAIFYPHLKRFPMLWRALQQNLIGLMLTFMLAVSHCYSHN